MIRALVTGGCGFIGSHLVEACLRRGMRVTVLDDLSVGRRSNLDGCLGEERLRVVEGDVADGALVDSLAREADWVFHLAARADIVPSVQLPALYHRVNVDGTLAVLEAARRNGVKRFLYAASSSCYGTADVFPTPESAPVDPRYPYALTKYVGEQYVLHWSRLYRLPALSLRLFNVYGPRVRSAGTYGAVFGVFLAQRRAGKPLTVVGDGNQTRDFTYVTDVAEAFLAAAQSSLTGRVFNVGSGGTYSVNELARLIGGPVTYLPKRPGEPDCTFADTTRIREELGWRPRVPFTEGVERLLAALDDWRDAPLWTPESIAEATRDWFRYLS